MTDIRRGIGRGRPKGSKNRQKSKKRNKNPVKNTSETNSPFSRPNKRGPTNIFRKGRLLEIDVDPEHFSLCACNLGEGGILRCACLLCSQSFIPFFTNFLDKL